MSEMQFNREEICRLIRACAYYQEFTGSEYIFDKYQDLLRKLNNYGEDVLPDRLVCTNIE